MYFDFFIHIIANIPLNEIEFSKDIDLFLFRFNYKIPAYPNIPKYYSKTLPNI